jgi:hypothetical protein
VQAVWIIGGGKFGLRAAEVLQSKTGCREILIIEKCPARCREIDSKGFRTLCADGVDFLVSRLESPAQRVWIVASAPVHLTYEWVRARISTRLRINPLPMPAGVARQLPNTFPGNEGQLYASNADFICPPDCSESGRMCAFTGQRRPRSMHAFIRQIHAAGVKILVIRSFQLAPGVGALRPRDLFETLRQIESAPMPVVLATACKCHAVLNSFKIISKC